MHDYSFNMMKTQLL